MNRREFIQTGAAFSLLSVKGLEAFAVKSKPFGCQLYSVRDQMSVAPIETMRKLAQMGYSQFESYSEDPLWGMGVDEAKSFFKEINVSLVSTHAMVKNITDEFAAKAKEVGLKYIICPYIGPQASLEEWQKRADEFNKAGELCNKYGIKFGYHNHDYSFIDKAGIIGQDILLKETQPNLVVFELDIYWIEATGTSSIEHFKNHAGRYQLCHVKQIASRNPKPSQGILKGGLLDFAKILKTARKSGVKYFFVEQEQYSGTSMQAMQENAAFMKTLKY